VAAALPGLAGDRAPMPVLNPLSEEMSHLRLSLLPGLCETLALNLHRGVDGAAIFELGRAFWEGERHGPPAGSTPDGADRGLPPLPAEPLLLGVAIHVDADATQAATEIRRCQALLDRVARELGDVTTAAEPGESPGLRPGRTAWVSAGSTRIGLVGELDPATVDAFDLRGRVVVAELRVDALASAERRLAQYRPVPRFPAVVQDLAVTVPVERRASQGLAVVRQTGGPLLEGVDLRDEFRGEQIGAGRKGWTFRLTFRSLERTLVAAEVQPWQDAVMLALRDRLGAEPRT
jgi:phenylalanyl-tRNA synthetase beta chain